MAFGLQMRGYPKGEIDSRVQEAARILKISPLLDRKPREMSGGQRQRVAMGRAIVRNPKVFLFDEPLSNLDAKLRVQMRTEIKRLHRKVQTTVVYVTHDQVEAMTMADRIVILRDGHIEQVGTPAEVYARPSTVFVASFIGSPSMNFVPCTTETHGSVARVRLSDQVALMLPPETAAALPPAGSKLIMGIRPEHLAFSPGGEGQPGWLCPTIDIVEPLGADALVIFQVGGTELVARVEAGQVRPPGSTLPLRIDVEQLHFFDPVTEKRVAR
jgi:multiple sugar transport system ATP-binding protein